MLGERNRNNYSTVTNKDYPNLSEFYSNLTPFVTFSIFIAILVLALNVGIFATTISKAKQSLTSHLYSPIKILCSFYPIISLAALITILHPKSWLICHTVMHLSFTFGAVVFHNLCFLYVHSEVGYLKVLGQQKILNLQTTPCCCCCCFLPKLKPKKTNIFAVKCLVWQMPLAQSSIMIVLNVTYYAIDPEMYHDLMVLFLPFLISSLVIGLWGLNITFKMINKLFPDHGLMKKMICLRLILLLCNLQYHFLDWQLKSFDFGGIYPISNTIYKQTLINLLILFEMALVSMLVHNAYTKSQSNNTKCIMHGLQYQSIL